MAKAINTKSAYEAPALFTRIYQLLMKFPLLQNIRAVFFFVDFFLLLAIKKPKKSTSGRKKLLVIVSFALGDCIMFMKAYEGIRRLYPTDEWEITVTCQKACGQLFNGIADNVIGLEYTKASVNMATRFENYKKLRERYYDLVIDPISSSECSPNVFATRAVCADSKIGFLEWESKGYQCPGWMRNSIYKKVYKIEGKDLHRIALYGEELKLLGLKDYIAGPAKLVDVAIDLELPEKFFILFPSASLKVKKWPIDRCAEIVDRIYEKTKLPIVLCGTEHDRIDAKEMVGLIKSDVPIVDMIGKTNVMQLATLIGKARFVITNDTSVYHISVAKGVDTFLLCGGYVYKRFAAYNYPGYKTPVLINSYMSCYDCNNNCTRHFDQTYPCVEAVSVDMVWDAFVKKLPELTI